MPIKLLKNEKYSDVCVYIYMDIISHIIIYNHCYLINSYLGNTVYHILCIYFKFRSPLFRVSPFFTHKFIRLYPVALAFKYFFVPVVTKFIFYLTVKSVPGYYSLKRLRALFHSFLWLSNISLYMYHVFFIHSSVSGY